jgi:hypothetical protein
MAVPVSAGVKQCRGVRIQLQSVVMIRDCACCELVLLQCYSPLGVVCFTASRVSDTTPRFITPPTPPSWLFFLAKALDQALTRIRPGSLTRCSRTNQRRPSVF